MIEVGKQAGHFFEPCYDQYGGKTYRIKSLEQYSRERNVQEQPSKKYFQATTLPDIIKTYPTPRKSSKPVDAEKGTFIFDNLAADSVWLKRGYRDDEPDSLHRLCPGSAQHESDGTLDASTSSTTSLHPRRSAQEALRPPANQLCSTLLPFNNLCTRFPCHFFSSLSSHRQAALRRPSYHASALFLLTKSSTALYRRCFVQSASRPAARLQRGSDGVSQSTTAEQQPVRSAAGRSGASSAGAGASWPDEETDDWANGCGAASAREAGLRCALTNLSLARIWLTSSAQLSSIPGQSVTPVLRREDQRLAWEARDPNLSSHARRQSVSRHNPGLDLLTEQAERGGWHLSSLPGAPALPPPAMHEFDAFGEPVGMLPYIPLQPTTRSSYYQSPSAGHHPPSMMPASYGGTPVRRTEANGGQPPPDIWSAAGP